MKKTTKKPPVIPKSYPKQLEKALHEWEFPPIPTTESKIHEAVGKAYLQGLRPNAILLPEGAYKAFCEEKDICPRDGLCSSVTFNGIKVFPTISAPISAIEMVEQ